MKKVDLAIIGGGSAGMAAALGAKKNGIDDILIIEKGEFLGGILNQCIHNGFGLAYFKEELTGPEFLTRFANRIEEAGIPYVLNSFITGISKDKVITYSSKDEGEVKVQAKAIIMAAGCFERTAGAIGIPGDRCAGIITAGQAQLYMNEYGFMVGKRVFILGSGDIGLIMARRMSLEGAKVLGVAEICPYSNGLNRNIVQCLQDYDIPLYLSHTVTRTFGKERLERIEISKVDDKMRPIPGSEMYFDCDTLLLSIGLIPYNGLLDKLGIKKGASRGSEVNEHLETSMDGVFSCGNVLHVHDLVDNVVVEAEAAGEAAAMYLKGELIRHEEVVSCRAGEGIGYVVPGQIDLHNAGEQVLLKFRVRKPTKEVFVDFSLDGVSIKRLYKQTIIPSEMEIVPIKRSLLGEKKGELVVSLISKEAK